MKLYVKTGLAGAIITLLFVIVATAQIPKTGVLNNATPVALMLNGKQIGSATLPKGTAATVYREQGEQFLVGNNTWQTWVKKTDLQLNTQTPTPQPLAEIQPIANTQHTSTANATLPENTKELSKSKAPVGKQQRVLIPGAKRLHLASLIQEKLEKAGFLVEVRELTSPVTEDDIKNYDIFWVTSIHWTNMVYTPEIFKEIANTKKLMVIRDIWYPSEIRNYGNDRENRHKFRYPPMMHESVATDISANKCNFVVYHLNGTKKYPIGPTYEDKYPQPTVEEFEKFLDTKLIPAILKSTRQTD